MCRHNDEKACTHVCTQAEIIPFPIDPEIRFIRQTARILERRQGERAVRFWRMECQRLYARLQVQGLADAEIRAYVDRFAEAVQAEMRRAAEAERQRRSYGGAA
ncbi:MULTISPECIES: DUF6074 family protein [unclassified Mesorhizobium]|uniref:DUF6074 family protein n=1 Tax=unclassified Mesorhizobium TaxID=325217 RepID=UPI00241648D4|nr:MULTISPECIES: DUF6074 family protein [unclassified Mesorhizobium]MDG4902927.1 DUF6074 family protein [Mesorhizobium sp. WSM4962]MDG4920254.1 DUF6074 family protein [Mesorhizobium sp. WSM4989]